MVWTKAATYTPTSSLDFTDWLFSTALPLGGWTLEGNYETTGTKYYYLKKPVVTADGDTIQHCLCYEHEYDDSDLLVYGWTGSNAGSTSAGTISNISSDTTWFAGKAEYGDATIWIENETDAFLIYRDRRIFAFGLSSGGYLKGQMNTSPLPGTRPYYSLCPVGDFGIPTSGVKNDIATITRGGGANVVSMSEDIYENRAWMLMYSASSVDLPIVFWQDPTNTWKQRAFSQDTMTQSLEVAQIGNEYYLNVGPWLLPAGTTEPVL